MVAVLTETHGQEYWKAMYDAAHAFCVALLPNAVRVANALTMSEKEILESA